jgi:RNA polymerase sigma-70 factor (ECF subfamily)
LLVTSVRRAAFDLARRESRRAVREESAETDRARLEPVFFAPVEGEERRAAIEAALARLSEEQREVLVLKIWGELTFDQIAAQLEISPNTAASRYRYALGALRKELATTHCHG